MLECRYGAGDVVLIAQQRPFKLETLLPTHLVIVLLCAVYKVGGCSLVSLWGFLAVCYSCGCCGGGFETMMMTVVHGEGIEWYGQKSIGPSTQVNKKCGWWACCWRLGCLKVVARNFL